MAERRPAAERRHERDVIAARPLALALVLTLVMIALAGAGLWWGYQLIREPRQEMPEQPLRATGEAAADLQRQPLEERAELEARMQQRLNSVGWVDRDAGVVHMPIDRAMDLLVERGLGGSTGSGAEETGEGSP